VRKFKILFSIFTLLFLLLYFSSTVYAYDCSNRPAGKCSDKTTYPDTNCNGPVDLTGNRGGLPPNDCVFNNGSAASTYIITPSSNTPAAPSGGYSCNNRPSICSATDPCAPFQNVGGNQCSGCLFYSDYPSDTGTQYCVAKGTSASTGNNNSSGGTGGTSTTSSIPLGQYGCSVKNDAQKTIVIACQNGGTCITQGIPGVAFDTGTNTYRNGYCADTQNKCPVCAPGYELNFQTGKCDNQSNSQDHQSYTVTQCAPDQGCSLGVGCSGGSTSSKAPPLSLCQNGICKTALGDLPTSLPALLTRVFSIALSIAGVVALGLIIASGYRLMISQGNPEQVKGAREQLTAAIIGLLFIIFSLVILQVIGFNILRIPGFG